MNVGIRRVGIAMIVLFVALVAQLTYLQVAAQRRSSPNDPRNTRKFLARHPPAARPDRDRRRRRRSRTSVPTNDEFKHQRVYPTDDREAVRARRRLPVDPVRLGRRRARRTRPSSRAATSASTSRNLADVVRGQQPVGTVVLTLSKKAQQAAAGRARRPARHRRRARRADRRRRRRVLEPHVRPEPARDATTRRRRSVACAAAARTRPTTRCSPRRGASSTRPARRSRR